MKKLASIVMAVIILCALSTMVACVRINSGEELDDYEVNLNLDKNIEADLKILVPVGDYEEKIIDSLILGFNDIYPNVTIRKSTVQIGDTYESSIITQYQSGILPDIIWTDSTTRFYFLVGKKIALNLNPYIAESEKTGVFDVEEDFYQKIFDMCSYQEKLYVVPRSHDNVVTMINTEQFDAAGIDWTQYKDGWTWTQFKQVCGQFRTYYDGLTPAKRMYFPITPSFHWAPVHGTMLESYGAKVFDGTNVSIDSAATREVLEEIKDMITNRYVATSAADGASENSFYSGNQAMIFTSEPITRNFNTAVLRGKINVLPYPLMDAKDNPKIGSGSAGYAINANTKVRDVAWAFLNYMLTAEGQQGMAVAGAKTAPIRRDLADFTTAKWGEGISDKNLSAYLFGEEYLMTPTFFQSYGPDKTSGITEAVAALFIDALNPNVGIEKCISNVVEELDYAIR